MHNEILPCPFCGGPAEEIKCYAPEFPAGHDRRFVCSGLWEIPTRKCPGRFIGQKDDALIAWNTRAASTPPASVQEPVAVKVLDDLLLIPKDLTDEEWREIKYNVDRKANPDIPLWRIQETVKYANFIAGHRGRAMLDAALSASQSDPAPEIAAPRAKDSFGNDLSERELVSIILRMSRHLPSDKPAAQKLHDGAIDYLRRKGLMPSPLRSEETVVQSVAPQQEKAKP